MGALEHSDVTMVVCLLQVAWKCLWLRKFLSQSSNERVRRASAMSIVGRVEQRIGRVDRIGGRPEVSIRNYFYVVTVEEQIYTGIADDVDWFEDIVGPAQPVLGQVEDVIEHIAMLMPDAERDKAVVEEIAKIRASIEEAKARSVSMDDIGLAPDQDSKSILHPTIDLAGLEQIPT